MRQLKISKQVTNRDTPSLDKYLTEIGKVKLITAQEEVELGTQDQTGDNDALEALCKANLRFVVSVAKQYQGQGLTLPDLISEGNLGLIKAAGRFDETRGFKFISYAVWWIRQQILQSLAEQARIVRLPLNKIGSDQQDQQGLRTLGAGARTSTHGIGTGRTAGNDLGRGEDQHEQHRAPPEHGRTHAR
jgi:RNA polymerase primary sigma factor